MIKDTLKAILQKIKDIYLSLIKINREQKENLITINPIVMESNQEKLAQITIANLDTDVSPADLAKDELGCAESVSDLIKKVLPDFPITLGTVALFQKLRNDPRFKIVLAPARGVIVISPTVGDNHGHCGIFISTERIASNNSNTGLFQGNYNWPQAWIATFGSGGKGLHTYLISMI